MASTPSLCFALRYTYYVTTCGSFARRDERFYEGLSYRDHVSSHSHLSGLAVSSLPLLETIFITTSDNGGAISIARITITAGV